MLNRDKNSDNSDFCDRRTGFTHLVRAFEALSFPLHDDQELHNRICQILAEAANTTIWNSIQEFEDEIVGQPELDKALVRATRRLSSKFLLENQDDEIQEKAIKDWILPFCDDIDPPSMEEYCKRYVDRDGECAEGFLVDYGNPLRCTNPILLQVSEYEPRTKLKQTPY